MCVIEDSSESEQKRVLNKQQMTHSSGWGMQLPSTALRASCCSLQNWIPATGDRAPRTKEGLFAFKINFSDDKWASVCACVLRNKRSELIRQDFENGSSIQHIVFRVTILGHLIHKENRNPSFAALFLRLSSKPKLDKRLFDSCSVPGSKKHESANLLNTSMWMRVSSNGPQTTVLWKECCYLIFEKYCWVPCLTVFAL